MESILHHIRTDYNTTMKYRGHYCTPKFSEGEKTYYGDVAGVKDIPMIEAADLDDFERLFHLAVDEYLDGRREERSRQFWSGIVAIITIIVVLGVAIVTCPKKEQHDATLINRISTVLSDELDQKGDDGFAALGLWFGSAIIEHAIKSSLSVNDYVLFSVGRYKSEGEWKIISVGAFGHVFTASKGQIKQAVKEYTNS